MRGNHSYCHRSYASSLGARSDAQQRQLSHNRGSGIPAIWRIANRHRSAAVAAGSSAPKSTATADAESTVERQSPSNGNAAHPQASRNSRNSGPTPQPDSSVKEHGGKRLQMLRKSVVQDLQEVRVQEEKRSKSRTLKSRLAASLRVAFQTYYTVLFYNTVVRLLKAAGADEFFDRLTPRLEVTFANWTGSWHTLKSGKRLPISLANNCDPDLTVPAEYAAQEFPFQKLNLEASQKFEYRSAHLLSLAMKLVYEGNDVIDDTVRRYWQLEPIGIFETATEKAESAQDAEVFDPSNSSADRQQSKSDNKASRKDLDGDDLSFIPATKVIILRTPGATIASFRGTEATNLLNWRTDIQINMTLHENLGGIHEGFYAALFHRITESEPSLFEETVKALKDAEAKSAEEGRAPLPLYIAGHSLGGAIATVFAQALAVQEPEVAARVAGVYTWGAPRSGDAAFARAFTTAYGDRSYRVRLAGDIVPFLIPSWLGYRHCGNEIFVSNFGTLLMDPEEIKSAALRETIGFPFLYVYNIAAGRLGKRRESWLRTLYRVGFMFVLPGFISHFPCEYERQMRRALEHAKSQN